MIVGTGIDVAEVARLEQAAARHGRRFLERIFTAREIAYCERHRNRFERYAARFAAKEAGMKALGVGWRGGVRWQDLEVVNQRGGKPELRLSGVAARIAERQKVRNVSLSLTHTQTQAVAQVILED